MSSTDPQEICMYSALPRVRHIPTYSTLAWTHSAVAASQVLAFFPLLALWSNFGCVFQMWLVFVEVDYPVSEEDGITSNVGCVARYIVFNPQLSSTISYAQVKSEASA